MANHAYVKLKKNQEPFDAGKINEIIERLNKEVFHNSLSIKWINTPGRRESDQWQINTLGTVEEERLCWLNNPRSFEIRHGGGSDFIWWIDCLICQEITKQFNGKWNDDGFSQDCELTTPYTFKEYQRKAHKHSWLGYRISLRWNKDTVPKSYIEGIKNTKHGILQTSTKN